MLVFKREPRQWFMIISPFVNVMSMILLLYTIVLSVPGGTSDQTKNAIRVLVAYFFPFFLLYGFCTSSGIYMIVSLLDKERKMRQYMFLAGVGPWAYYLGLYCADFLLYCLTVTSFTMFVFAFQLKVYTSQFLGFFVIMIAFGGALIPFTYLFQHWFKSSDSAFRFIGVTYICLGCLVPVAAVIVFSLVTLGNPVGAYVGNTLVYVLDPLYVFYMGVYDLVFTWLSKTYFPNQPVVQVMINPKMPASPMVTSITCLCQAIILLLLVVWKDTSDCNAFKKVGGKDGAI